MIIGWICYLVIFFCNAPAHSQFIVFVTLQNQGSQGNGKNKDPEQHTGNSNPETVNDKLFLVQQQRVDHKPEQNREMKQYDGISGSQTEKEQSYQYQGKIN